MDTFLKCNRRFFVTISLKFPQKVFSVLLSVSRGLPKILDSLVPSRFNLLHNLKYNPTTVTMNIAKFN